MFDKRRSIRKYKTATVEEEKLQSVLEAGRWAPSWANSQCGEIVVVRELKTKKKLAETLSKKNPATLAIANAPVVLAICGIMQRSGFYKGDPMTKFGDWCLYDLGLLSQNICLAAHQQGLGTVIVGAFDHDKAKEILCVPEDREVVALLPLGYPDHQPPIPKRKSFEEFVHYEWFE